RWLHRNEVPDLQRCSMSVEVGGVRRRCEGNLLDASPDRLPVDHPTANTQSRLSWVLSAKAATWGIYAHAPTSSLDVLADLRMLAARILNAATANDIDRLLGLRPGSSIAAEFAQHDTGTPNWGKPEVFAASAPALITGIGLTLALNVVTSPTLEEAASRLRPIIKAACDSGREVTPSTVRHGTSAAVHAAYLRAFAPSFGPLDQLRFRALAHVPRYPAALTDATVRGTPACCWPGWSLRFLVEGLRADVVAPAMSILLLSTGTPITAKAAARHLGSVTTETKFSHVVMALHRHPLWPNIAAAITRLAHHLAQHPSPIDYQRRRQLDYQALLPAEEWHAIHASADFGPRRSRERMGELVRSWLFERISRLPADSSPFAADIDRVPRFRAELAWLFTPTLVRELDDSARQFLQQNDVIGEPVTWSPPLSIVEDLELPIRDTASVSPAALHQAHTHGGLTMAAAARRLKVPTAVVQHLLENSPCERPPKRNQTQFQYAMAQLTAPQFDCLYRQDQMSLRAIAARVGVKRNVISKLARTYGIELRSPHITRPIDPDWIYHEYVEEHRTITDMAQEIGVSIQALSRRAKSIGIAVWRDPRQRQGTTPPHRVGGTS
ncbi:MAG: hypothetical protein QOI29_3087, partial [Mycobacterium sp.]|nr:hypothetical protein [Mycobacterium sp.]